MIYCDYWLMEMTNEQTTEKETRKEESTMVRNYNINQVPMEHKYTCMETLQEIWTKTYHTVSYVHAVIYA